MALCVSFSSFCFRRRRLILRFQEALSWQRHQCKPKNYGMVHKEKKLKQKCAKLDDTLCVCMYVTAGVACALTMDMCMYTGYGALLVQCQLPSIIQSQTQQKQHLHWL